MAAVPTHEAEKLDGSAQENQQESTDFPNANAQHESSGDTIGNAQESEKREQGQNGDKTEEKSKGPSGGFDSTPIPFRPNGYTIKITVHRAENLPMADINAFSSDPYCLAQINTDTPKRHKEDPYLRWRSVTVRRTTEPSWEESWIVANVPASGFKLKVRIYDEDPADADDLLGKVHITVPHVDENWPGIQNESYRLITRDSSKRAYLLQAATTCFRRNKHFRGHLHLSISLVGRTAEDGQHGRLYTVGPARWLRHFSPMLGRFLNVKDPDEQHDGAASQSGKDGAEKKKKVQQYNFQANQIQLEGPVPAKLYHRFVEFKPWVGRMFTSKGFSGVFLGKALHHQHTRVYNFGRSTNAGTFEQGASEEVTKKFLELVHYDQGGRIFTYVLTLDALWRFTETGKEFGIDMLSKHTMHSDVSIYIAFSGEFFVRRLKNPRRPPPPRQLKSGQSQLSERKENEENAPEIMSETRQSDEDPPNNPNNYQLVIDNDSGTYRPNAALLPLLKAYLSAQLPGLHILTLDCNADAERQQRLKKEQRERKKTEGDRIVFTQGSRASSISSSELEELDHVQADLDDEERMEREHGVFGQAVKDAKLKNQARMQKIKNDYVPSHSKPDGTEAGDADAGSNQQASLAVPGTSEAKVEASHEQAQ